MRRIKVKLMSLLLITCLILQLSVSIIALAADIPDDLTGETDYLVVHGTTDDYEDEGLGGPSSITVEDPDGEDIPPNGNRYEDVPAGSTVRINYVFHLENDDGDSDVYEYSGSNYFTIALPEGITFVQPSGDQEITATDNSGSDWTLGTWSFEDERTIRVDFSDEVSEHSYIWGELYIDGVFNAFEEGDDEETSLFLGSEEVVFCREVPPPPEIELEKDGEYDPSTNEITWEVTVTPPDGTDLGGYSLVDEYSDNQSYKPDSFYVGDDLIDDGDLDLTESNTVIYTFPSDTLGKQTITYKTIPTTFSEEGNGSDKSVFENTAYINNSSKERITEPVDKEVEIDWISKEGSTAENGADIIIRWSVEVSVPNDGSVTGAEITDTIPAGLQLIDNENYKVTVDINGAEEEAAKGTGAGTYSYDYTDQDTQSLFTYRFPQADGTDGKLNGTATLTYYTKVSDRDKYLDDNATIKFTNNADFSWAEMPGLNPPGAGDDVDIKGSGGLITKTGGSAEDYEYPGYIHWTITANRNGINITDLSIKDTVNEGQKLLIDPDHPLTVKKNGSEIVFQATDAASDTGFFSDDGFDRNFTYAVGTTTNTYTVDYYTQIVDSGLNRLYVNAEEVSFGNDVWLLRGSGSVSITGTKTYKSQMIKKEVGPEKYNYSDHTVQWKITVNRNQLPLTNARIEDEIPDGMTLFIDEEHPFQVVKSRDSSVVATAPTDGKSGDRLFTYEFDTDISDEYIITYYTHLEDDELITQWNNKGYTNEATLYADEIDTNGIEDSATVTISNPVITKGYEYEDNADHIDWSVIINPAKIELIGAEVSDQLNGSLELDAASLKLYEVDIDAEGKVSASSEGTLLTSGYGVELPNEGNNNTLTVTLPNSSSVYRLEFTTYILTDDTDFVNSVSLTGQAKSPSGSATANRFSVSDLWAKGGSGNYSLTVHKEDGSGNPVKGAEYQLLNRNQQPVKKNNVPITAVTNDNGDAVFNNLPSWVLYAQEVTPPEGYLINEELIGGNKLSGNLTYSTNDLPAVGKVELAKISTSGVKLSGGEFTLVGTDYANNIITRTAKSVKGTVTFENIPLGTYKITETKAPNGYYLTDEEISVEVTYNNNKTNVTVDVSPDTLENKKKPDDGGGNENSYGSIKLKKTDSTGKALSGAEFGLYNMSGNLVKTAVSKSSGTVEFKNVAYGTYTIREISAPDGYRISDVEITATVSKNDKDVSAYPYVVVDYKTEEEIPENPDKGSKIRVSKIDSVTKLGLPDAEFALYDKDGDIVRTVVSDKNGIALFAGIEAGNYTIREIAAPEGYILSTAEIAVAVTDGNTYEFTVENTPKDVPKPVEPKPGEPDTETPSEPDGGSAEPKPSDQNTPTVPDQSTINTLPQTGGFMDTRTLGVIGVSFVALGFGVACARWRKRR